jgi:hypothetical protein
LNREAISPAIGASQEVHFVALVLELLDQIEVLRIRLRIPWTKIAAYKTT